MDFAANMTAVPGWVFYVAGTLWLVAITCIWSLCRAAARADRKAETEASRADYWHSIARGLNRQQQRQAGPETTIQTLTEEDATNEQSS